MDIDEWPIKNRFVVCHAIPEATDGVEPAMHNAARLAALGTEGAIQHGSPERRVVSGAQQADPKREFEFSNDLPGADVFPALYQFVDNVGDHATCVIAKRRLPVSIPISAISVGHLFVDAIAQADFDGLERRVEGFR